MKIEIQKIEKMGQTGKSLLDILQSNDIPFLDLFIRESIQNSLDAADKSKDRFVELDLICKDFDSEGFSRHLEGVTDRINEKYSKKERYIALRDSKTNGLTGPLTIDELVESGDQGNLISLVYSISKRQREEGSGGSWGLGKTSYFRMGNGLVIYYSRIKTGFRTYQSRLVVSLVEDEESIHAMIPKSSNIPCQGLAWWGEKHTENTTKPITDERLISEILKNFDFPLYKGDETGTSIIIPYIDEERLLSNKIQIDYKKGQTPYWYDSIAEYFEVAVQRWYFPRLDNSHYRGKHFKLKINNKEFSKDDMAPVFKVFMDMYNISSTDLGLKSELRNFPEIDYEKKDINITTYLNDKLLGYLVSAKVPSKLLDETAPNNGNKVYEYLNKGNISQDLNTPIIGYSRKPGMVISYEYDSPWLRGVDSTESNEYLLSFFTLNSDNILKQDEFDKEEPRSLEEYIRGSEKAEHSSWHDTDYKGKAVKIVERMQRNIAGELKKFYNFKEKPLEGQKKSGLSGKYGSILLPKTKFGAKGSKQETKVTKAPQRKKIERTSSFDVDFDRIAHKSDGICIPFRFSSTIPLESLTLELKVATDGGALTIQKFEETLSQDIPFKIESVNLTDLRSKIKNSFNYNTINLKQSSKNMTISNVNSLSDLCYGVKIDFLQENPVEIEGLIEIENSRKDIKLILDHTIVNREGISHE